MNTEHIFALWQDGHLTNAVYLAAVMAPSGFDLAAFIDRCERALPAQAATDASEAKVRGMLIGLMHESMDCYRDAAMLREVDATLRRAA